MTSIVASSSATRSGSGRWPMLVEHKVETDVVARLIFVVVAMKQIGGGARIAFAIGQDDSQRSGMVVPGRVIGLFAELIGSHVALSRSGVICRP
jgi:hypothetical protein